jgi:hypothetical protein
VIKEQESGHMRDTKSSVEAVAAAKGKAVILFIALLINAFPCMPEPRSEVTEEGSHE